jgi:bifunctional DNA-binding transcriptional regulator/antitoxin component of YhaV-PrlF toxin-antitoxin module
MTDYKKYSLGQVENFLYDAMSSGATPQEIYDVIKGVVEDNYYTYKNSASEAYELLALLNGNGVGHVNLAQAHSEHYYDFDRNKPVVKTCDKDNTPEECKKSWNSFWEEPSQYTDEELDAMCDAAEAKDKVVKWSLPVEVDGPSGEYFITFPDDLLEAANLKEGEQVEWIDQGDGSYLMKKVEKEEHPSWVKGNELSKVKTYQELIDDGWSMTDDGFWIKEN